MNLYFKNKFKNDEIKLLFILFIVPFIWHAKLLIFNESYFHGDILDQFYPWWNFIRTSFKEGRFPLWNPYVLSGTPFHLNPQSGLYYPPNYFLIFLPFYKAFTFLLIINSLIASYGMYYFLKDLRLTKSSCFIGSILFSYGSFMTWQFHYIPYINTMVWFPLQLLFLRRIILKQTLFNCIIYSLVTACSFFGGTPQVFYVLHIGIFIFLIFQIVEVKLKSKETDISKILIHILVSVFLFFGLTLILLLPLYDFIEHSIRNNPLNYSSFSYDYSMPSFTLKLILFPFYHIMTGAPYPPLYYLLLNQIPYVGLFSTLFILLSFFNKKNHYFISIFLITLFFGIIMSRGAYSNLFCLLYNNFKIFRWFRWPYDYLHMIYPFLAILVSMGFEQLKSLKWKNIKISRLFLLFIIIFFIFDLYWYSSEKKRTIENKYFKFDYFKPVSTFIKNNLKYERVSTAAFQFFYFNNARKYLYDFFPLLVNNELNLSKRKNSKSFLEAIKHKKIRDELFIRNKSLRYNDNLKNNLDYPYSLPSNVGCIFKYQDIGADDPMMIERVNKVYKDVSLNKIWNLCNVKYIILPYKIIHPQLSLIKKVNKAYIYKNKNCFKRVSIPKNIHDNLYHASVFQFINKKSFNPQNDLYLEDKIPNDIISIKRNNESHIIESAKIIEYKADKVIIEANLKQKGFLVLNDIYFPGWSAYSNLKEIKIFRANYIFRAVLLDKGKHIVTFVYKPKIFYYSAFISISLWIVLLLYLFISIYNNYFINFFNKDFENEKNTI